MINKAQAEFRTRNNTDNREFATWYDNEDIQRLIWQIYQNIPANKKHHFLKSYVFYDNMEKDEATTLNKLLDVCHQLLREKNLNYFPFLFKPKLSQHFYAGLVQRNPNAVYLFIPNGVIPANETLEAHLGLSSKYFIANLPLVISSQSKVNLCLPNNKGVCTLLSIEFLEYIMNHEKTFEKPHRFLELLKIHSDDYQSYINKLSQKQKRYLPQAKLSKTSPQLLINQRAFQGHINNAQQTYLQYFSELANIVREVELKCNHQASSQALKLALLEARIVINELRSLLPVNTSHNNLLPMAVKLDDTQLLRLADLCSHLTHGLVFINQNQAPHQADIFSYTSGSSGSLLKVSYDLAAHQQCMRHISETALLLPGAGWHGFKTALFILAGSMIIVCGVLVAASATPIGASLLLTLAGAAT